MPLLLQYSVVTIIIGQLSSRGVITVSVIIIIIIGRLSSCCATVWPVIIISGELSSRCAIIVPGFLLLLLSSVD